LLYQAELAQDYFGLHGNDTEAELLTRTEASYKEYLTLTQNRFSAGIASDLDVAQAEAQLYFVQSQLMDLGVGARGVGTRHRHPNRQSTRGTRDSARHIDHNSATGAGGGSVGTAGTKAGHRRRGAEGGRGQRADWNRHGGLLSQPEPDGERRG